MFQQYDDDRNARMHRRQASKSAATAVPASALALPSALPAAAGGAAATGEASLPPRKRTAVVAAAFAIMSTVPVPTNDSLEHWSGFHSGLYWSLVPFLTADQGCYSPAQVVVVLMNQGARDMLADNAGINLSDSICRSDSLTHSAACIDTFFHTVPTAFELLSLWLRFFESDGSLKL